MCMRVLALEFRSHILVGRRIVQRIPQTVGCILHHYMCRHIAWKRKGKGPYMEDLNSTLVRPFLEGLGPIEKQN